MGRWARHRSAVHQYPPARCPGRPALAGTSSVLCSSGCPGSTSGRQGTRCRRRPPCCWSGAGSRTSSRTAPPRTASRGKPAAPRQSLSRSPPGVNRPPAQHPQGGRAARASPGNSAGSTTDPGSLARQRPVGPFRPLSDLAHPGLRRRPAGPPRHARCGRLTRVGSAFAKTINDLDEAAFQALYGPWDPERVSQTPARKPQ